MLELSPAVSRVVRWLAVTLFVGVAAAMAIRYYEALPQLSEAHWQGLLLIAAIHTVTLATQARSLQLGLRCCGREVPYASSFSLTISTSYANLFLPRSGLAAGAALLHRRFGIGLIEFGAVTLFNGLLFLFACSLGLLGVWWLNSPRTLPTWVVVAAMCVALGTGLATTFRLTPWLARLGFSESRTRQLNLASEQFRSGWSWFPLFGLQVAGFILRALRLTVAFWALDVTARVPGIYLASALGDISFVFSITPSALGFREAAIALGSTAMQCTVVAALSVALVDRLAFSAIVIILAQPLIFSWLGIHLSDQQRNKSVLPAQSSEVRTCPK